MIEPKTIKYPMLEAILEILNLPLKPMYSTSDIAKIFNVCARAIQNRASCGELTPRNLPGRAKYLAQDLEDYLKASQRSGL